MVVCCTVSAPAITGLSTFVASCGLKVQAHLLQKRVKANKKKKVCIDEFKLLSGRKKND